MGFLVNSCAWSLCLLLLSPGEISPSQFQWLLFSLRWQRIKDIFGSWKWHHRSVLVNCWAVTATTYVRIFLIFLKLYFIAVWRPNMISTHLTFNVHHSIVNYRDDLILQISRTYSSCMIGTLCLLLHNSISPSLLLLEINIYSSLLFSKLHMHGIIQCLSLCHQESYYNILLQLTGFPSFFKNRTFHCMDTSHFLSLLLL